MNSYQKDSKTFEYSLEFLLDYSLEFLLDYSLEFLFDYSPEFLFDYCQYLSLTQISIVKWIHSTVLTKMVGLRPHCKLTVEILLKLEKCVKNTYYM